MVEKVQQEWLLRPSSEPILWPVTIWAIYMIAVLQLDVVPWLKIALFPLLMPWVIIYWQRYCALNASNSVVKIELGAGGWRVHLASGETKEVRLAGKPWFGMNWLGICWQDARKKKFCAIVTPMRLVGDFKGLSRALLASWRSQSTR
ncbi:MAG: hypothetical protein D6694_06685 [Gammaproteobacteria bacterium]|nr:MAG: hypothetical protein D6694_06685 [Gammaproteobacteria bacterium]